jgi:hypothetical protein
LLGLAVLATCGAVFAMTAGTEGDPWGFLLAAIFLATQFLFLGPRRNWVIHLSTKARPMKRAAIGGAAAAAAMSFAVFATLAEVFDTWEDFADRFFPFIWFVIVLWLFWSLIFWIYWRGGDRFGWLSRMVRRLLIGSLVELVTAVSVQICVPDRYGCWCARGSFFGIVVSAAVMVWTFGPAVALVFLAERVRARRAAANRCCRECDYDLTGTLAAVRRECPECGAAFDPQLVAPAS